MFLDGPESNALREESHRAIYVPERFAHGYQVLQDKTETSYQVGEFYAPGMEVDYHTTIPHWDLLGRCS